MPLDFAAIAGSIGPAPGGGPPGPSPAGDYDPDGRSLWSRVTDFATGSAAAVAAGVVSDPFIGGALNLISRELPEVAPERILSTLSAARGQPGDRFFELAGSLLPIFATGGAAMLGGRAVATGAARALSPRVAAYLARGVGDAYVAVPGALRAAQVAGTSLGMGGETFAREMASGAEPRAALKAAGVATALTGGMEGALIGAGRVLRPGPRVHLLEMLDRPNPAGVVDTTGLQQRLQQVEQQIQAAQGAPVTGLNVPMLQGLLNQRTQLRAQIASVPATAVGAASHEMSNAAVGFAQEADQLQQQFDALIAHGAQPTDRPLVELTMRRDQARVAAMASRERASFLYDPTARHDATTFYYDLPRGRTTGARVFPGVTIPGRIVEWLGTVKRKLIESPETAARRLGVTMTHVVDQVSSAARQARAMGVMWGLQVDEHLRNIAAALPQPVRFSARNTAPWLGPIRDMWETPGQGLSAIQRTYGTRVAQEWDQLMTSASQFHGFLRQMGVEPQLTRAELQALGVENYFPQHFTLTPEMIDDRMIQRVVDYYAARGERVLWEEARARLQALGNQMDQGLSRAGSLDFQRTFPGTTAEKAAFLGLEVDPRRALLAYGNGISHRYAWGQVFGPNMELKPALHAAAVREGANGVAAREVLDNLLGVKYRNQAMYETARFLGQVQILSKLGLGWIPNAFQSANNFVEFGLRPGLRGMHDAIRGTDRAHVEQALGAFQGMSDSIQEVILGQDRGGPMDWMVRHFLTGIGFNPLEEFNRVGSGFTGQYVIRDTVGRLAAGRLRGARYAEAERTFDRLGLSLEGVGRTLRANGLLGRDLTVQQIDQVIGRDALQHGISNAAKVLQFVPDVTRLPEWWTHPVGRLVFQFKSFAFNQAKFIRDSVIQEAAAGNMKPLMALLAVYPPGGEVVQALQGAFTGKPRTTNGITRLVEDVASMGALGLAMSGAMSLTYRDGAGWLFGPTFSDVTNLAQALAAPAPLVALQKELYRKPTFLLGKGLAHTAGGVGRAGVQKVTRLYQEFRPASGEEEPITDANSLRALLRR